MEAAKNTIATRDVGRRGREGRWEGITRAWFIIHCYFTVALGPATVVRTVFGRSAIVILADIATSGGGVATAT